MEVDRAPFRGIHHLFPALVVLACSGSMCVPPPYAHEIQGSWLGSDQHGKQYALDLYGDGTGMLVDGHQAVRRISEWELRMGIMRISLDHTRRLEGRASAKTLALDYYIGRGRPWAKVVLVRADQLLDNFSRIQTMITEEAGTLEVRTEPPDAAVMVDGRWIWRTGDDGTLTVRLLPRRLTVSASKLGYEAWSEEVDLPRGGTVSIEARLQPLPDAPNER